MSKHLRIRRRDYGANARGVEAVDIVFVLQLIRGGNRYRADLMQRDVAVPEFIIPFKDKHYAVAFADTEAFEKRSGGIAHLRPFAVGDALLVSLVADVHYRSPVGLRRRDKINVIVSEVEFDPVLYFISFQMTFVIKRLINKSFVITHLKQPFFTGIYFTTYILLQTQPIRNSKMG